VILVYCDRCGGRIDLSNKQDQVLTLVIDGIVYCEAHTCQRCRGEFLGLWNKFWGVKEES